MKSCRVNKTASFMTLQCTVSRHCVINVFVERESTIEGEGVKRSKEGIVNDGTKDDDGN